ncbi:MAG: hypothetical protein ABEJ68_06645 [Halobacteriaceae archaeon]
MTERGQLVVLAAALVAVALLPMVAAYLQLGYQPTTAADRGVGDPAATTERALSDALARPATNVSDRNWSARGAASLTVRRALGPTFRAIRNAGPPDAATRVAFNDTAARRVAETACPAGPNRQFGPCRGIGGVVVQARENRTHLVAVAVDVTRASADGRTAATLVVFR